MTIERDAEGRYFIIGWARVPVSRHLIAPNQEWRQKDKMSRAVHVDSIDRNVSSWGTETRISFTELTGRLRKTTSELSAFANKYVSVRDLPEEPTPDA